MQVLIVDDSGTMRTIQKRTLNSIGITEISEGADGQQGLTLFESGTFDFVLTDWNMPIMDGLQLVKEIRARNKDVPIVMVTTEAERSRIVTAIQAGVSDYLIKPFTPQDLRAKVEKWIPTSAG